jgi:site-specific recombinase XerC
VQLFRVATGYATPVAAYPFVPSRPNAPVRPPRALRDARRSWGCPVLTRLARRHSLYRLEDVSKLVQSGLHPATINSRLSHLRIYWAFLIAKDVAKANPWVGQSVKRDRRFRLRSGSAVWAFDEVAKMLTKAQPEEIRAIIEVLVYSGCRI